jgi:pyruvate,water dikinase
MVAVYGVSRFEFNPQEDLKNYTVFLADVTHGSPPWRPLYFIDGWGRWAYRAIQRAAERLSLPTTRGWDIRYIDGYPYPTVIETTEAEMKARTPLFRERIKPYIEDFDAVWEARKTEIMDAYRDLKKKYGLGKYEDIKKLSNIDLLDLFDDFMQVDRKQWDIHMEMMVSAYYLFGLFDQMCAELLGFGHDDPRFARLMAGFESVIFRFNKEILRLANRAAELGLGPIFQAENNEKVILDLKNSDIGKIWLKDYRDFLEIHGWRTERMQDWATPNWIEKPSLGIPLIKIAISQGGASTSDERREQAIKDREAAEREILAKVAANQKPWFSALMKAAQKAGYWSEDHNYYLDFYCSAIGRWITREIGRRFTEFGVINEPQDVYFLIADEIEKAIIPMGKVKLHNYVDRRKQEWETYLKLTPKPFYGNIEMVQQMVKKDPVITASTSARIVREEAKADLYSAASAPGLAEGRARVVETEDKMGDIQRGEILVTSGISTQWTSVFEIIGGIVTDGGGALSHAVILAREYGIPAVVGCLEATRKIKTGDKLKVDGNLGLVYILEHAQPVYDS